MPSQNSLYRSGAYHQCWNTNSLWDTAEDKSVHQERSIWTESECLSIMKALPYDSRTPMTSCESNASPNLSAWTSFIALSWSRFFMLQNMDSFHVSSISFSKQKWKQMISIDVLCMYCHLNENIDWCKVYGQNTEKEKATFLTILSSTLDFLLLPWLPNRVISNLQKGLGRISHCVKNFLHSTM